MSKKKSKSEKLDNVCENLIINGSASNKTMQGIYKISLDQLATIQKLSETLINNHTSQEQYELFNAILVKCNSYSYNFNKDILALKADTTYQLALLLIEFNQDELRAEIREEHLSKALEFLDQSNILIQNNDLSIEINADKAAIDLLKAFGTDSIEGSYLKAFELAQASYELREEKLQTNHSSILHSLLTVAEIGKSIGNKEINIEAIKYAKLAYNMAITVNNLKAAANSLQIQADIFQLFGDEELSLLLNAQAQSLLPITLSESKKLETSDISKIKLEQIVTHGTIDKNIMAIKEAIQESVLDPIKVASSRGKWVEFKVSGNMGVSGYLGEFLKNQLGNLDSNDNLEIALELCFEAINLGIMSSSKQNPLCAAIFAQEYPKTIDNIIEKHPEYFVDGFILKTSLLNASEYSKKLLGHELIATNDTYNSYFEKAIVPYVTERLNDIIYKPIVKIIVDASWNSSIEQNLLTLTSEKYLTNTTFNVGTSYLGQNLGTVGDMMKIVQVTAFKTIISSIVEQGSTNYSPIAAFAKEYPEIVNRVLKDHPEYLCDNKTIIDICNQILTEFKSKNSESNEQAEITLKNPVETDLIVLQNTDNPSNETEIVGNTDSVEETY